MSTMGNDGDDDGGSSGGGGGNNGDNRRLCWVLKQKISSVN